MFEDIVGALSSNPVINHIFPHLSSIVSYFSEVLQLHSIALIVTLRMLLVQYQDAQRHG